jgi:hypothetical protein
MKLLGSITELVFGIFRQNQKQITLRPNASTDYSGGDVVVSLPNQAANCELVSKDANQALTNKTIDASLNTLSNIVNSNISASAAIDWTKVSKVGANLTDIPTRSHTSLSDIGTNTHAQIDTAISASTSHIGASSGVHGVVGSVVGTTDSQVLSGKTIDGDDNTVQDLHIGSLKTVAGQAFKFLSFGLVGVPTASKAVPSGDVVGTTDSQYLESKFLDESCFFDNSGATDKTVNVDTSGATAATNTTIAAIQTANRVIYLPDANTTLVGTNASQTLTNKTLTGGTASATNKWGLPEGTTVALTALTRIAGLIYYSTDDKVVYFDNGTSLLPIGSAGLRQTKALLATTSDVVVAIPFASYQNVVVKYSLTRGVGEQRMGQLFLMYDGTLAHVADQSLESADCGVVFSADVNGSNFRLLYTTTGASCSLVYFLDQWSN